MKTKTYELYVKAEDSSSKAAWVRLAAKVKPDTVLEIGEDYYIERKIYKGYLLYIHVKEGRLVKVCVYRRKK